MRTNSVDIEARLNGLGYRDLEGRNRTIAVKILEAIEKMNYKAKKSKDWCNRPSFFNLRKERTAGTDTFRVFIKWLYKTKLIDKEKIKRQELDKPKKRRGRLRSYYILTKEGKAAVDFLKIPEYKRVEFRTYGLTEKKIILKISKKSNGEWGEKNLGADELSYLIKSMVEEIWLFGTATSHPIKDGNRLEIEPSSKKGNKALARMIRQMLEYSQKALLEEVKAGIPEASRLKLMDDEIIFSVFPSPSFCLPLGLGGGVTVAQRIAMDAYQRYWIKKFKKRSERKKILSILKAVRDSDMCRKWIEQRLEETPNYFVPSPLWAKLDFNVPHKWDGKEILFPYNIILVEPRFARILSHMRFAFYTMAEEGEVIVEGLKQGKIPVDAELEYRLKKRFIRFLSTLGYFQNVGDFYEAWRVLRESFTSRNECYKELIVFKPLQESFHRYIIASFKPTVNLWKAYLRIFSDLGKGKDPIEVFDNIATATANGKYALEN